jgi:hypothetical protein
MNTVAIKFGRFFESWNCRFGDSSPVPGKILKANDRWPGREPSPGRQVVWAVVAEGHSETLSARGVARKTWEAGQCDTEARIPRLQAWGVSLEKTGIRVAEYLTELPPPQVLKRKLHDALQVARESLRDQT